MNMQHNGFVGRPIAAQTGEGFEGRMRRISAAQLDEGALATMNCRISAGKAPWFALRVWTGRELVVEKSLSAVGLCSLVPMRKGPDLRRRHRVIEGAMMPVMHGYVLVQVLPVTEYLTGILGVEHVIDVLGGCEHPKRLSEHEVSRFNSLAGSGAYDWERPVDLVVAADDKVIVTDGPFAGHRASVVTPNRKGRGDVVVSIRIMGGEVPVSVPLALLRKL